MSIRHLVLALLFLVPTHSALAQYWESLGYFNFTGDPSWEAQTAMVLDTSGLPCVAFYDFAYHKASVKRFDGTDWMYLGSPGFSAGGATNLSIAIDKKNTVYVAYQDSMNSFGITVMKYDGSGWVSVGGPDLTVGTAPFSALAIDTAGWPYVAYETPGTGAATVQRFNGTSWETVGAPEFSGGGAQWLSLVFDRNNTPYVSYMDWGNGQRITVMKYAGGAWTTVGAPGFSIGLAYNSSLVIDTSGTPYVAFQDAGDASRAIVKKFDGTSWVSVGTSGAVSAESGGYTSLLLDAFGSLYLAFQDEAHAWGATAMKFNGTDWEPLGATDFSSGNVWYTNLAIDKHSTIYASYVYENTIIGDASIGAMKFQQRPSAISGDQHVCVGSTITLVDSVLGGVWTSSDTLVATVNPATGVVAGLSLGADTISYALLGNTVTIAITVDSPPSAGFIVGLPDMCLGDTMLLTDTAAGGIWHSGASASISGGVVTAVHAGADTVSYIVTQACGADTATHVITINQVQDAGVITGPTGMCLTDTIGLTDTVSGGVWSVASAHAAVISGQVTDISAGTDTIRYITTNICGSDTASHVVVISSVPDTGTITGADTICTGYQFTLSDTASGGIWSSGDTGIATVSGGVVTAVGIGETPISFTVTNGVCTRSAVKDVVVTPVYVPSVAIVASPADSITYLGETISFFIDETYGGSAPTYQWYVDGSPVAGATSPTFSVAVLHDMSVYCVAVSDLPCAAPLTDTSNTVHVYGNYLSVEEIVQSNTFIVYPDPASSTITVESSRPIDEIAITNLTGQCVGTYKYMPQITVLDIADLPSGVYFIRINGIAVKKFVRQ